MYFSFKFNFGNDPTVSPRQRFVLLQTEILGTNDIIYPLLYWPPFLFADEFRC